MAGRGKSVGHINYHELPRKRLQSLCKKYGFPANKTNMAIADALTVLLNAPERLAMGIIDSPAISRKSSYILSSCDVEESPRISPGVDSLSRISQSKPEVLRITKHLQIMKIDASTREEVSVTKTVEAKSSTYCAEEMHSSEIAGMMTDNSTTADNPQDETHDNIDPLERIISSGSSIEPRQSNIKENSTSPLGLLDSNIEPVVFLRKSSPSSPKSPAVVSIHKIMLKNCASIRRKNGRTKRHPEIQDHLSRRWKEKALRAAEMNAISLREKILKRDNRIAEDSG